MEPELTLPCSQQPTIVKPCVTVRVSYITADRQSVSQSWLLAPKWDS